MSFNQKVFLLTAFGLIGIFITFVIVPAFSGAKPVSSDYYIGPIRIHIYSWITLAAVLSGFFIAKKIALAEQLEIRHIENLVIINTIAGLFGARLYHVITEWGFYSQHLVEILAVWRGGLGIFGGIAAGTLATYVYARIAKISFLRLADIFSIPLTFGLALGRIGNFFNYEVYGPATELPWKMFVPFVFRPQGYTDIMFFHPTFIYESVGLFFLAYVLYLIYKKSKNFFGYTFVIFLLLYFMFRTLLATLRLDITNSGASINTYFSLALIGVAFVMLWHLRRAFFKFAKN